ncbi:MAG: hypothetical protein ACOX6D_00725 [Thermoguttaceae bacterium]|jgi:pimeloyl-ACP methyl ester carboxylesterase
MKTYRLGVVAVLFIFVLLTGAGNSDLPIVWYIHGMVLENETHSQPLQKLEQIFPDAERLELITWDAPPISNKLKIGVYWNDAVPIADKFVDELTRRIIDLPSQEQRRLILVGHSLGGRIAIKTAARCTREGITLRQIITSGAAINNDDPDIAAAINASEETFFNLVNQDDYAMGAYKLSQRHYPLGTGYLYSQPSERFFEAVVDGTKSHLSYYYFARLYDGLTETVPFDNDKIIVPQEASQIDFLTTRGYFSDYKTLDSCRGWQLQQQRLVGHCRILDPKGIRRASGHRQEMYYAFEKVRDQLNRKAKQDEIPPLSINVLQDSDTVPKPTMGGHIWWKVLDEESGWKLQKNVLDQHCRILDPSDVCRASGKEEIMRVSFNLVRKQLLESGAPPGKQHTQNSRF